MSAPSRVVIVTMVSLLTTLFTATTAFAHEAHVKVNRQMVKATQQFLDSLDDDLRAQATFDFDGAERTDWHFIPKERVGVKIKDMDFASRRAAHQLIRVALSNKGYLKATAIMSLEQVLRVLESDNPNSVNVRDQEKYWFSVFGRPGTDQRWGWRVEGHHLSLNFTAVDGLVVSTPMFLGANPAEVRGGPRAGLRVLGREETIGRNLIRSMDAAQRAAAIIDVKAPKDILTVPGFAIDLGAPVGVAVKDMKPKQRNMVMSLIREYISTLNQALSRTEMEPIKADMDKIHFAWAGGLKPGEGHYYRIHGTTFIIEYDNTQNGANHAHAVWHSLTNDFALDTLRKHHEAAHN